MRRIFRKIKSGNWQWRGMTDSESKAFDNLSGKMDDAFSAMDRAFDAMKKAFDSIDDQPK